jgi:protein TonB
VRFVIADDGSFEASVRTSSGSSEVDELTLAAARRWRWKPALRDGQPISSSQIIRFKINR